MRRRLTSVLGVVALTSALPVLTTGAAQASPAAHLAKDSATSTTSTAKPDNLPDPLASKRADLRQRAMDALANGKATIKGKGAKRAIQLDDGTLVSYPATQTAQLLTFLVDFGNGSGNAAFPDNTAGPVHNTMPQPDASDNSTYWEPDFSRDHYQDMFFNGLPDQGGESFHNVYDEMSSGRFDLQGDVSDWVTVPHPESFYQSSTGDEDQTSMTNFIGDSATAWYDAQVAAGKTDAEIKAYLASFDQWDRYDLDGDGITNEPDGYIDHFQAIHAGGGEEAGEAPWAIWSHRWSAGQAGYGTVGPQPTDACSACAPIGGVEIGDTGYFIRDYTTEPENGGLGVFSHEFGHDLGLPDYYDTNGGDNGTGFWNLMSSGSWMNHGAGTIGTTPDQMGATEKLFLGWYGTNDLATVDGTSTDPQEVTLGPSYHATKTGAQALMVSLPQGHQDVHIADPEDGTHYFYSGTGDSRDATLTSPEVTVPAGGQLTARINYDYEVDWDYGYVEVSTDGGTTYTDVPTNLSTDTDPNGNNHGYGITGSSDDTWVDLTADLSAYAGQPVTIRFESVNDEATHFKGMALDELKIAGTTGDPVLSEDVEGDTSAWTLDGYAVQEGSGYSQDYDQYYLAENRQYDGYDKTLAEGPYSFDYPTSAPDKVDHFPYQDGLLVWYANGLYTDNNTSGHEGGSNLPVDANPGGVLWKKDSTGAPAAYASGRIQTRDSTFDVDETDALHLHSEASGGRHVDIPAQPGVPVFEDSDVNAYMDDTYSNGLAYSTPVAGAGAEIQVLSSDESTGKMVLKVGGRFVAATDSPSISGSSDVGGTLKAHGAWFQSGVTETYQWLRDGAAIDGATSATYTIVAGDLGHRITAQVTGSKDGYTPTSGTSLAVTPVPLAAPTAATPTISGTFKTGETLAVSEPVWSDADVTTLYQWTRDGQDIAGATASTYTLTAADVSHTIGVKVTGQEPGHVDATLTGEPVSAAGLGDAPTAAAPAISGTVAPGKTVSATAQAWSLDGVATTWQWSRDGKAIAGAAAASYKVALADAGHQLTVTAIGTKAGYAVGTTTSAAKVVPVVPTTTKAKAAKAKHQRVKVTVTVTATGFVPSGTVTVTLGGKHRVATLSAGKAVVSLPAKGKKAKKATVVYAPAAGFGTSTTTVRVKK